MQIDGMMRDAKQENKKESTREEIDEDEIQFNT